MDAFIRFTNQSQGRDRLFRATQYTCMLLRYLLEPKADNEKVVMKLKKLESSVSTGRKYLTKSIWLSHCIFWWHLKLGRVQ
uniref:Peroxisomal biogenesis factor 11 alpha n=1 Tax=Ovis aries TaxID=9940 RepID=A0AC11EE18_SHEEP